MREANEWWEVLSPELFTCPQDCSITSQSDDEVDLLSAFLSIIYKDLGKCRGWPLRLEFLEDPVINIDLNQWVLLLHEFIHLLKALDNIVIKWLAVNHHFIHSYLFLKLSSLQKLANLWLGKLSCWLKSFPIFFEHVIEDCSSLRLVSSSLQYFREFVYEILLSILLTSQGCFICYLFHIWLICILERFKINAVFLLKSGLLFLLIVFIDQLLFSI